MEFKLKEINGNKYIEKIIMSYEEVDIKLFGSVIQSAHLQSWTYYQTRRRFRLNLFLCWETFSGVTRLQRVWSSENYLVGAEAE